MTQRADRRPFVAGLLSFVQPGLGHLYLRHWVRAALWATLWFGTLGLVLATLGLELTAVETLAALSGVFALVEGIPTEAVLSLFAVTAFATMDAYWLAAREGHSIAPEGDCPHCGRELDPSLDFCHWCTASLESEESA